MFDEKPTATRSGPDHGQQHSKRRQGRERVRLIGGEQNGFAGFNAIRLVGNGYFRFSVQYLHQRVESGGMFG